MIKDIEDGEIREGCHIVKKGEIYEKKLFTVKDERFKSNSFLDEVKRSYTELINLYVKDENQKLQVFQRGSVYLATKKIGKRNPKALEIEADNRKRQEWNRAVDMALISGIQEPQIMEVKQKRISEPIKSAISRKGRKPNLFAKVVAMAIETLELMIETVLVKKYKESLEQKEQLQKTDASDMESVMPEHIMGENGISYTLGEDGLYYPDLYLPEDTEYPIGKYGMLRKTYLKEHRKGLYLELVLDGKLNEHLHQIDEECHQMMDRLVEQMKEQQGVQEMVRMVDVKEGMSICDPACGVGKFLLEAASKISSPFYFENGKLKAKIELVGMEKKMEDNTYDLTTILAKSNMLIYYSDLFKNNCDSIEKIQELSEQLLNKVITSSHTTLGTLENLYLDKYDLILANPPYYQSAAISEASKSVKIYGTETKAYTSGGRGIEALFTEWIVKSIKKGGIANIILPDGIFTNIGNNKLKQLIIENCYIDSIISLPVGTFFNTPKKTFILTIHKRTEEEMNKIQSYPVYTYLCSTIGETMDTYRFDIDENDLHDAVDLYNLYRGNKENKIAISAVNDNPRAKLIPVDKFGIEENWNIELFWSDEEKIELGIKKKDTIMSLEEFHGYISELIDDIKNYQEAIECLK